MKMLAVMIMVAGMMTSLCALAEPDLINLKVPSSLEKNQLLIQIQHRFWATMRDPVLGMAAGANDGFGLRYVVVPRFELNGGFVIAREECTLGASYAYFFRPAFLRTQVDLQYVNFKNDTLQRRTSSVSGTFSLASEPIFGVFTPAVNVGFDGYNRMFGLGAGLGVQLKVEKPPLKSVGIIGEYFPVASRGRPGTGPRNCFGVGVKLETWGHHFIFMVGNSYEIGTRRWMAGAPANSLHLGFNINRMVDLGTGL